ncbi:MAG: YraN family protein [Cephaloticoccus sp.]|nr:YraN family protein [Cephaloticoccus sp.]MCF7761603.1 YraN family protein [Cephaloticoccus sp.]
MFAWIKALLLKLGPRGSGVRGEKLAARHLRRQAGYRIVATNWRSPRDRRDELDLVALDGETLVFVEVKTRAGHALVQGYHAVDERKKRVVERAARVYLRGLDQPPRTVRFDIVEVAMPAAGTRDKPVVRHFANVPLFPKQFRPGA